MLVTALALSLLGLAMGSFVGALVWRLHEGRNFVSDRSECEKCHHKLGAADLVPVFSWLLLRGKCRYCGAPIGVSALLIELGVGAAFLVSYLFWPFAFDQWQAVASFGVWLTSIVILAALFLYDMRWRLLPDKLVYPLIGLGLIDAGLRVSLMPSQNYVLYVGFGMLALAGVYGALYVFSRGKWVGFGDVKLSLFIGAVLGWQKALLVLALSNLLGLLVVAPGLMSGKLTRHSRVAFGPFLIAAFFIAGLFGDAIIDWYIRSFVLLP